MRVFNQAKTQELTAYDLALGYLQKDKLFVAHHDAVEAVKEVGHYNVVAVYPNGGKDVEWVVDTPAVEAREAYDEYEEIFIYIPYSEEELEAKRVKAYEDLVESLIRQKYTISNELAILRQKDDKPEEFQEYYAYAEQCKVKAREKINAGI